MDMMTKQPSEPSASLVGVRTAAESALASSSSSSASSSSTMAAGLFSGGGVVAGAGSGANGGFIINDDNYDLNDNSRREMSTMTTMNSIYWLPDVNSSFYGNMSAEAAAIQEFPYYIRITSTILCGFILFIGIIGNILVPVVVWRNKDLRSSTNIFLINLSLADLLILLVCMPPVLIELHSKPEVWVLGAAMCKSFSKNLFFSVLSYQFS